MEIPGQFDAEINTLGRGFLTGTIKSLEDLAADDYRRQSPRLQGNNFQKNLDLVNNIRAAALRLGCTPGQLALAWVLAQGDDIVPIPGTKHRKYLEENAAAVDLEVSAEIMGELSRSFPLGVASGTRYPEQMMQFLEI